MGPGTTISWRLVLLGVPVGDIPFQLDSPQEWLPHDAPCGPKPLQPSPGQGQDGATVGRCRAGLSCWHCLTRCPMACGDSLAMLGALAGFYGTHSPLSLPCVCTWHGFVVWNTFLIKPGNEQGTQVVHATPGHGARTGLDHHQFLPGLTLANPSCPATLVSAPLGHPATHGSPSVTLASEWPLAPRAGPARPLLLAPGSSLPCWFLLLAPLLPSPGAAHGHPPLGLLGRSEWHKPSCDPLVNVAASRARAPGGPGCGSCVTGGQQPAGGSSTSPGSWWPVLALLCVPSAAASTHLGERDHPHTLSPSLGMASAREGVQAGQCRLSQ